MQENEKVASTPEPTPAEGLKATTPSATQDETTKTAPVSNPNDSETASTQGTGGTGDGNNPTSADGKGSTKNPNPAEFSPPFHTTPLSPMHQPHIHNQYFYGQNVPHSPATPMNSGYDSILSMQNSFARQQYPVIPPLSPHTSNNVVNTRNLPGIGFSNSGDEVNPNPVSMGTIPPASPLFPGTVTVFGSEQIESVGGRPMNMVNIAPNSPNLQYLGVPPPSPVVSYGFGIQASPEQPSWSDRPVQQNAYHHATPSPSPQIQPIQYTQNRRTTSFDGNDMLPPSAFEDSNASMYSSGGGGATYFSQQQPWSYNADPQMGQSPRTRPPTGRVPIPGIVPSPPNPPPSHMQYYPAVTPGPPIQTTHHNKGPEGANLFIFHIPNHFTNLDMWQLFCHYGTLLSVRIMVEKDTGRSRGFGFVSYDSPDSAALAIKELNGFVIGNKRLKVQHKQIRPGEREQMGGHYPEGALQYEHHPMPPNSVYLNDHTGAGVGSNVMPEQHQMEGGILNMDQIGEALPEVAK
jgi:CUG-BP- and ETR3-like factor